MAGWAETLRGERLRFDHLLLATGAVAAPADRVGRAARRRAIWGDVDADAAHVHLDGSRERHTVG